MNPITRLKCAVRDIMRDVTPGRLRTGRQVRPMPGNAATRLLARSPLTTVDQY